MSQEIIIPHLHKLLQSNFDLNIHIVECTTKRLTAAGDNYGSLMVRCNVKFKKENCEDVHQLQLVAKISPPNEWLRIMFKTDVAFGKEIGIYAETFPALQEFQKKQGKVDLLNCFPKYYGARLASNNQTSEEKYSDSIILLENLKDKGFVAFDRLVDFKLEESELLIKSLAVFHAVPLAMKMLDSNTFSKKVLPYLNNLMAFDLISEESKKQIVSSVMAAAGKCEECVPLLATVERILTFGVKNNQTKKMPLPSEPFATLIHNDLWVTNTMMRFENGKPIEIKFIDFQHTGYGSPGNDIVFFLFSSVQKDVLDKHYESLVKLYYVTFIDTLTNLKCDTTPFTYEKLLEEIDNAARTTQFCHVMFMLRYILAKKGTVKDIFELSEKSVFHDMQMSDEYMQRVPEKILAFAKRGWI